MNSSITKIFVGIDISKNSLDVHLHPLGKGFKIANSEAGIQELLCLLQLYRKSIKQIVCEASGGYEYALLKILRKSPYHIWRVDPKRIRHFIISEGIKVKTDKIDAKMLALFAAQKKQKYHQIQLSEEEEHLQALVKRRTELVVMLEREKHRLNHPIQVYCKKHISNLIVFIESQLKEIEQEINKHICTNNEWKAKASIIESVRGLGKVTAFTLIAQMPELGKIGEKQAAAPLGVAPFTQQSGNWKGSATIHGGRSSIRRALYMAVLAVTRFNPQLRAFYERLCKAGKRPKIAITAVMRKLIVILNIMLKKGETWSSS